MNDGVDLSLFQPVEMRQAIECGPGQRCIILYCSLQHQLDGLSDEDLLLIYCRSDLYQRSGMGLRLSKCRAGCQQQKEQGENCIYGCLSHVLYRTMASDEKSL